MQIKGNFAKSLGEFISFILGMFIEFKNCYSSSNYIICLFLTLQTTKIKGNS